MTVERTSDEIIIKISSNTNIEGLQRLMDYIEYTEIASKSKATQSEIDQLATEVNKNWWENNKNRFIKQ